MSSISINRLQETVRKAREKLSLTQQDVQDLTGINRLLIGRMEKGEFLPSLLQLNILAEKLNFDIISLIEEDKNEEDENAFCMISREIKSQEEMESINRLFSMMSFLKSQMLLRSRLG